MLIIAITALALAGACWQGAFAKEIKIGYVNFMQVYNEYQKTKDYDVKLEGKKAEVEKNLNAKKEKIEELRNKLNVLNEKEQAKEKEKVEKEIQGFRELERKAFIDIKKERDEKMKEIFEDVSVVVQDYAKKKGYDLILDQPAILYGDKVMDVTADILKGANEKYKK
jgi:outer membrane protein